MKQLKVMVIFLLILTFSCSEDDEEYDFSGIWNLTSVTILNSNLDYSNQYNFNGVLEQDGTCLTNSVLSIFPNKTAVLRMTSKVESTIQIIDGTTNELEQVLTCLNQEEEVYMTWATGDYSVLNDDGSITTGSSAGYDTIRFLDENQQIAMSGFLTGGSLGIGPASIDESPIYVEVEGEEIGFTNGNFMFFNR